MAGIAKAIDIELLAAFQYCMVQSSPLYLYVIAALVLQMATNKGG
jgi:hypothetical protein